MANRNYGFFGKITTQLHGVDNLSTYKNNLYTFLIVERMAFGVMR